MDKKLLREIRVLKIYSLVLTLVLLLFLTLSFTQQHTIPHFEEVDIERINIVEKDGTLKMVISNSEKQHPGLLNGKELPARSRDAGLMFFNSAGDECGGLVYDGNQQQAGMVFSVDQYKNDQVMQLQYSQDNSNRQSRTYGLKLWDRSDKMPLERQLHLIDSLKKLNNEKMMQEQLQQLAAAGLLGQERLFVGKTRQQEVGLFIRDRNGKPRIKLYIDAANKARLEFLDEKGKPVKQ